MARKDKAVTKTKKKTATLVILLLIFALLAVFAILYLRRASYYKEHFYTGTTINGYDCSDLTAEEAEALLQQNVNGYVFELTDKDSNSYSVTGADLGLQYVSNGEAASLLELQKPLEWIFRMNSPIQGTVKEEVSYDQEILKNWLTSLPCFINGVDPVDAYKEMQDDGFWHIIPETQGSRIDIDKAMSVIDEAIRSGQRSISLTYEDVYVKPQITSTDQQLNEEVTRLNNEIAYQKEVERVTNVTVTLEYEVDGVQKNAVLTPDLLKTMIVNNEENMPVVSGDKIIEWLTNWAEENGILDNDFLFLNCYGEMLSLPNGSDTGWKFDITLTAQAMYDAVDKLESKTVTPVLVDENGEKQTDQTYIEIIIPEQRMILHKDGQILVDTPVVTGSLYTELDYNTYTPSDGIWHIFWMTTNYTLKGPIQDDGSHEYESDVNYWMPFNGDVGIHDMNRTVFGAQIYKYAGSHGCINTPLDNAETIYKNVSVGTPVIVWGESGSIEQLEASQAKLEDQRNNIFA